MPEKLLQGSQLAEGEDERPRPSDAVTGDPAAVSCSSPDLAAKAAPVLRLPCPRADPLAELLWKRNKQVTLRKQNICSRLTHHLFIQGKLNLVSSGHSLRRTGWSNTLSKPTSAFTDSELGLNTFNDSTAAVLY